MKEDPSNHLELQCAVKSFEKEMQSKGEHEHEDVWETSVINDCV